MSNPRLIIGSAFAVLGVALALINDLGMVDYLNVAPSTTGIAAFIFALVAFFVAVEKGSVLISTLLVVQGIANSYSALSARAQIGVYFGLLILALGLTKVAITGLRALKARDKSTKTDSAPSLGFHEVG